MGLTRHFVELFSTETIQDLSVYKITTQIIKSLPKVDVPSRTFILLQGSNTDFSTVLVCNYTYLYGGSKPLWIKLQHGKHGARISKGNTVIDTYGTKKTSQYAMTDACNGGCSFRQGWAKRKDKTGPNKQFKSTDWVISKNILLKNKSIKVPYPCMEYEAKNGKPP